MSQSGPAADDSTTAVATRTLGTTVDLPAPLYRADDPKYRRAGGKRATSSKTFRSDARTQSIRAALSKVLLGATPSTITLDQANTDPALGEVAILCTPLGAYAGKQLYQNYLDTLVKNIDAVSNKTTPDSTILDALKLLFASSGYNITDAIGVDPKAIADAATKNKAACEVDLKSYAPDYYGVDMPERANGCLTAAAGGVVDLSIFGPVGTLITTFLEPFSGPDTAAAQSMSSARRQGDPNRSCQQRPRLPKRADSFPIRSMAMSPPRDTAWRAGLLRRLVSIRTTPINFEQDRGSARP